MLHPLSSIKATQTETYADVDPFASREGVNGRSRKQRPSTGTRERRNRALFVDCCVALSGGGRPSSRLALPHGGESGSCRMRRSVGDAWGGAPPCSGRDGERGEGGKHGSDHE
jgi:hypothetical protein